MPLHHFPMKHLHKLFSIKNLIPVASLPRDWYSFNCSDFRCLCPGYSYNRFVPHLTQWGRGTIEFATVCPSVHSLWLHCALRGASMEKHLLSRFYSIIVEVEDTGATRTLVFFLSATWPSNLRIFHVAKFSCSTVIANTISTNHYMQCWLSFISRLLQVI